ncbi:MAG TPA: acyltransferase [Rhizomicrobium sp.]|nr:acyltransferase [Rhizomicrobium sp.]
MDSNWRVARRRARRLYTLAYGALSGVAVGRGAIIMHGAKVSRELGGTIRIGDRSTIHPGAMLLAYGGFIRLGVNCSVNPYSILYGHGGLMVGDNVRIAAHCVVIPANHGTALGGGPIASQPISKRGIRIGSDVWLGAGVRVLDGAVIGDGCVVAAGAVVRGDLESCGIYGGVPARLLGWRKPKAIYLRDTTHGENEAEIAEAVAAS